MEWLTLVTGGARSGKSTFALDQARAVQGKKRFIATAVPFDDEMRERIAKHQGEREKEGFMTVEAPDDLAGAVRDIPAETAVAVVDCLTVWLGNVFHRYEANDAAVLREVDNLVEAVRSCKKRILIVTNEVGSGIVPENPLARRFRDMQGLLNRKVAEVCDTVYLVVCGIPVKIKSQNTLTPLPPLPASRQVEEPGEGD